MKRPKIGKHVVLLAALLVLATTAALVATRQYGFGTRMTSTPDANAVPASLHTGAPHVATTNPTAIPRDRLLAMDLVPDQIRQVGAFGNSANRHDVYLGPMTDGTMCLIEDEQMGTTPDGRPLRVYGKACSPGLLQDHAVIVSISDAGGGSLPQQTESIVGIARPDVASVTLEDSAGTIHAISLNTNHAFDYTAPTGVRVVAVVAYSSSGAQIERRPLNTGS